MWTDSTTNLQRPNSTTKHPIFIANSVTKSLEHTSADDWNHVASSDNPADTSIRGMSADALQSSSWMRVPELLRTIQFPFEPSPELVNNIKIEIATKKN